MKTSSWEIILAGFIFVGVAIYIVEHNSESSSSRPASAPADSIRLNMDGNKLHVIQLKALKNLENLENLENLGNLQNLKNLENLKNLSNFLPHEFRNEFESEIDAVIKEFDQESVRVKVDPEKGTVVIDKSLSVSPGSWHAVSPGVFAYVNEFDAANIKETDLKLPFGSIDVIGSSDTQGKLTIQASGQVSTKAELQSTINTVADIRSDHASFNITPKNTGDKDHNIHLQATLTVPKNSRITSVTNAGHISSKNINGTQSYQTLGGHVALKNVNGEVNAKTSGGHITVTDSEGELDLSSKGGHIRTQNTRGSITMETSGGNLEAINLSGSVKAFTKGGNIDIRFHDIKETTTANTGAGTITIWVPKNLNADIKVSGNSVEIEQGVNFSGQNSSGTATGKLGNGGPAINANTSYGKVILKVAE